MCCLYAQLRRCCEIKCLLVVCQFPVVSRLLLGGNRPKASHIYVFRLFFSTRKQPAIKMLPIQSSLKDILKQTQPYFEENIKSQFLDEIERRYLNNRIFDPCLKPAFILNGDTTIELSQMNLMKSPNFVVKNFDLNMEKLIISLLFEIPEFTVEGVYKTYGNDVENLNVIDDHGNIMFVCENVICEGVVPIQISEDSFIVKHHHLSFNPSEIKTKKSSNKSGKVVSSETIETNIDNTYVKSFLPSLRDCIFYMLFRDLAAPIVEFSVTELFSDEPEDMIEFSNQRCQLANDLINAVLRRLAENEKKSMELPDLNLVYEQEGKTCTIQFSSGELGNLTLWDPVGEAFAVYEVDGVLYLEGELNMREFKYEYKKCLSKSGNTGSKGTLMVEALRPKFSFKASIRKVGEGCATKLEHFRYYRLLDVDYYRTGLENLDGMDDQIESWVAAFFHSVISEKLIDTVEEMLKSAIDNADLPKIAFTK